jgi:hypothetical protein
VVIVKRREAGEARIWRSMVFYESGWILTYEPGKGVENRRTKLENGLLDPRYILIRKHV